MSLNIKKDEAHRLAVELSQLTGESLTRAVIVALRKRLEEERRRARKPTADELLAIGRRCAGGLEKRPISHARLLYDARGLPK